MRYVIVAMLLLCSTDAHAWDKVRKGFILNGGFGLGGISEKGTVLGQSASVSKFAYGIDVKIGYAPDNRNALVWVAESTLFNDRNVLGNSTTFLRQLNGIGIIHWFKPTAPSPFITGAIGIGVFDAYTAGVEPQYGLGFSLGVGGEVSPHVNLHGSLVYISDNREVLNINVKIRDVSFRVLLSFTGY